MRLIFVEYVPDSLVCALYPLCFSIFLGYPLPLPEEVVLYQFNKGGKGVACKVKQVVKTSVHSVWCSHVDLFHASTWPFPVGWKVSFIHVRP